MFSFSFLYSSNIANVTALSMLYVKHPNMRNNMQPNLKAIWKEKKIPIHDKLGVTYVHIKML